MMGSKPALSCKDKFDNPVVMTRACFNRHKNKRPELRDPSFFPSMIIKTLKEPTFTIKGLAQNKFVTEVLCYYYEVYNTDKLTRYIKVIVDISHRNNKNSGVSYVCSVWRPDKIQETRYGFKPTFYN